ncbi:multicopper oxidase family protein [Nonomuraea jiangxiensis]|uniref:Multicopper oxidase with three cupredoxin domains (Includes cell division protein FtsP and spore coat protein CotA) n=1 Tax=Nonomuraea jiangxiensis TaxID=633440 RepID=A0A1G7Z5P5_9ACTN|nr:multicopper oxidase family protein [Nonomuraea jiangxiensis]SDH04092.1 Multicopper oxidase with three cupredoxin domains (includes cell division protein FtsP and spore coat protein CotA) [Nonomuraea jiangxiensis]
MAGSLISRRAFLTGVFAALGATAPLAPGRTAAGGAAEWPGAMVLRARPATVSLGRRTVSTWAYGDTVPGPLVQVAAGETVAVRLVNELPAPTTVHWHGIRIDPRMDGAPGFSQAPTRPGGTFDYVFTAPDPGTYFYHSHVGMQSDRGLYGPLIITDPDEPLDYDEEFTVVLDDWLDGIRGTPDAALRRLNSSTGHDDTLRSAALGGVAAELRHPVYLLNGRGPDTPETFATRSGRRVRFRVINAAADTPFRVALGGHRMTITHTDGFPCAPVTVDTFIIGMGERYDFVVRLDWGAFPLVAVAEGKRGRAYGVVRTSAGAVSPLWQAKVPELQRQMLKYQDLNAESDDHLPRPTRSVTVTIGMRPSGNEWTLNGRLADDPMRVRVEPDETIRLILDNRSPMWHPMHLHGHTFQLRVAGSRGPRKDTVNIKPRERLHLDVLADNPGEWMFHCHNLYHQEQGMMGTLGYGPPPPRTVHAGHHRTGPGGRAGHGDRSGSGERGGHHARGRGRPHTRQ